MFVEEVLCRGSGSEKENMTDSKRLSSIITDNNRHQSRRGGGEGGCGITVRVSATLQLKQKVTPLGVMLPVPQPK